MALSKVSIFDRATAGLDCQDIYHAGETCAQMWLTNCKDIAPAAGTLMAPFVLVSRAYKTFYDPFVFTSAAIMSMFN